MSRRKRPSLEERLDQISDLRHEEDGAKVQKELGHALASRQHLVVGRAARLVGDLDVRDLIDDLIAAFDRFLEDPVKTDKGCIAKTAIAKALFEMDHPALGLYRRGIRHVQMEASWGPPVDTAIELRAHCALGLANAGPPDTVLELVPLLVDPGLPARLAAVQGIAASGRTEAEPVLRLKALTGDAEPEVVTEACTALLRLSPERALAFVRPFLEGGDPERREAVILALGESRLEEAVPILQEQWKKTFDRETRRAILLALVTTRREPGLDFLLALVAGADAATAAEAITALAIQRHDESLRQRVEDALEANSSRADLRRTFGREFRA